MTSQEIKHSLDLHCNSHMHRLRYLRLVLLKILLLFVMGSSHAEDSTKDEINLSAEEIAKSVGLSLSKLPVVQDHSNKFLNKKDAIELGRLLFHDQRLSSNKNVSCGTCHLESNAFTDNKSTAIGLREGFRNTPTLLNSAQHNWFFADGSKDSLWAQALGSIENPAEHNFSRVQLLHFIASDKQYASLYKLVFDSPLPNFTSLNSFPKKAGPNAKLEDLIAWKKMSKDQRDDTNHVFVNIGKAIAAYVSTLQSKPTRFDQYLEEIQLVGHSPLFSDSEIRGLKLFLSEESGCLNCHNGPFFSNKEFHDIGTGIPGKDNGRSEVLENVKRDSFNCLGKYSDAKPEQCQELRYMSKNKHALAGAYKTPTLRSISKTAPYMHDGRYETLAKVIEHYSQIADKEKREVDFVPAKLNPKQQQDLINFLLTL